MKICARCGLAILPGEDCVTVDKTSASAGGITVYLHKGLRRQPAGQTAPEPDRIPGT